MNRRQFEWAITGFGMWSCLQPAVLSWALPLQPTQAQMGRMPEPLSLLIHRPTHPGSIDRQIGFVAIGNTSASCLAGLKHFEIGSPNPSPLIVFGTGTEQANALKLAMSSLHMAMLVVDVGQNAAAESTTLVTRILRNQNIPSISFAIPSNHNALQESSSVELTSHDDLRDHTDAILTMVGDGNPLKTGHLTNATPQQQTYLKTTHQFGQAIMALDSHGAFIHIRLEDFLQMMLGAPGDPRILNIAVGSWSGPDRAEVAARQAISRLPHCEGMPRQAKSLCIWIQMSREGLWFKDTRKVVQEIRQVFPEVGIIYGVTPDGDSVNRLNVTLIVSSTRYG